MTRSHPSRDRPVVFMFLANAYQIDPRVRQEAKSLVEANYPVFVLSWDRQQEFKLIENMDGATVISSRLMNLRRFSAFGLIVGALVFQVLLVFKAVKLISRMKQRPIIHAHDFNTLLPGCFLNVLGLCVGLVYDSHEFSYAAYSELFAPALGQIVAAIEKRCLRYVEAVITVSEPIVNYLRRFNPVVELICNYPRASDIPEVSKLEARRQLGLPLDAYIVSYVGSIRFDCRLDLMLAVASLLWEKENIHFLVVGGGPLASEFEEAVRSTRARLSLIPRVSHERALHYVKSSDLTWSIYRQAPKERVGISWKFFESMACGVPLIVGKETYQAEWVKRLGCGTVLENEDPNEVSQLIISLANNRGHYKCGATKEFTWELMSKKLIETYKRLSQSRIARNRKLE